MHVTTGVVHTYMHIQVVLHAYTSVLIVTFIVLCYHCILSSLYCVIFIVCNWHCPTCSNCRSL